MLNQSRVLDYIKSHLGFPFQPLEWEDEQIIHHVTEYTLREFSYYIPQLKRTNINLLAEANQVPARPNEFYLEDLDGIEILNIKEIYFPLSHYIMHGHPPLGPLTHGELREFALLTMTSMDVQMHSSWDKTYEFIHPNIVRISPLPNNLGNITVEYERMQPADFRGIPNDLQIIFCEFALADTMIVLGNIRKKYDGNMRTPFGEIPISSGIYEEGKEKRREVLDKLKESFLPNVTIEFG
jgi:hypothetical protein